MDAYDAYDPDSPALYTERNVALSARANLDRMAATAPRHRTRRGRFQKMSRAEIRRFTNHVNRHIHDATVAVAAELRAAKARAAEEP